MVSLLACHAEDRGSFLPGEGKAAPRMAELT